VKLSRPARTRLGRALVRAPIWLYRLGLGGLLGGRFLLLTHTGRRSGRPRQVVLEVVGRHEPCGGFLVASGSGTRSQWFRNILEDPRVRFQVGRRRYQGLARPLPAGGVRPPPRRLRPPPPPRGGVTAAGHRPGRRRVGRRLRAGGLRLRARDPAGRARAAVSVVGGPW
jgi:deazaflavin-dependent oxidoreductase (nitroreductase family)